MNNAFAGIFARFLDATPEEFERVTDVTYLGQVNGTRAALQRKLPRDRGSIVLVRSALAYRGSRFSPLIAGRNMQPRDSSTPSAPS